MKSDCYFEIDVGNEHLGRFYPFNGSVHEITQREGYEKGKDYELATGTDYDDYDWIPFYQSEQFKELVS